MLKGKRLNMSKKKMLASLLAAIMLTLSISSSVFAFTPSYQTTTATRNHIANNWKYSSRGYAEQNCLSYAIGKGNVWTWPWGSSNPTKAKSQTYLKGQGYTRFMDANVQGPLPSTKVYAYILSGGITHFAKQKSGGVIAKWGSCEIFTHTNANPYTNNVYGKLSYICSK